jgi:hypothetical protein
MIEDDLRRVFADETRSLAAVQYHALDSHPNLLSDLDQSCIIQGFRFLRNRNILSRPLKFPEIGARSTFHMFEGLCSTDLFIKVNPYFLADPTPW